MNSRWVRRALLVGIVLTAGCAGKNEFTKAAEADHGSAIAAAPKPADDAQYTITCAAFMGPDHVQKSRVSRDILMSSTRLDQWYVVHSTDKSTLYYGYYKTVDPHDPADPKAGVKAAEDLAKVKSLADSHNGTLFPGAMFMPVDEPDPAETNPKWNLLNANAYWTVELAAFKGTGDRKARAVQAVRALRAEGAPAYYYHGVTVSSVCLGAWPRGAADEVDTARAGDDEDQTLVVTDNPLPSDVASAVNAAGARTVVAHVKINDPVLLGVLRNKKYDEHALNGGTEERTITDPKTGQVRTVRTPLILMKVPETAVVDRYVYRPTESIPGVSDYVSHDTAARPSGYTDPTAGGLRSLER